MRLTSWVAFAENPIIGTNKPSINYAWYGSISPPTGCYNGNQQPLAPSACNLQSIHSLQKASRDSQQLSKKISRY